MILVTFGFNLEFVADTYDFSYDLAILERQIGIGFDGKLPLDFGIKT